ncbi:MAG: flagellar biosynthesis protein FlgD, partial [Acidobacteria bacterium]|nr:flagellar biosynthesis protein FlgD [Acidobacteriota bacterium]
TAAGAAPRNERDMFMTLLVAQLKNQDPLAPQDGTEFVAQLAQFNSLDQLIGIRQSIDQLSTLLNQHQKD